MYVPLPIQVMVATICCEEIANENFAKLASDEVLCHNFNFVWRFIVFIIFL